MGTHWGRLAVHEDCIGLCGVDRAELAGHSVWNKIEQGRCSGRCPTRPLNGRNDDMEINQPLRRLTKGLLLPPDIVSRSALRPKKRSVLNSRARLQLKEYTLPVPRRV
jgi:hypothetical protein